ncbi:RNA recognition motif family protein [Theileria parva strain Muguga]|uniref:U2 small nuclear ribonucleoprotein, auxiliary factor, large subunit, putative n=1 Tax=Theileria parva TaxID=5875 RepID=Q4N3F2_THEPA|nr:RNA recognition motif family protein [Theileria parva strain Muguga]EAN31387.1 RNA recognition motif family protein [Theileria parva strain Muguga]|eukprot:XP_763670.1 U2 small nuclear ribonucleoprotein, auxiliary factor, large subunit [Theileria parva strain Muguga]
MGQTEDLSNFDKKDANQQPPKRRRRREGKWDTIEDTVSLTELKAKTSEEEAKKRQKRLYVGNLPSGTKLQDVVDFFNGALMAMVPGNTIDPRDPLVTKTEIYNPDQGYCFLEFKTPELADLAFKLDGITCNGYSLKLRRPLDFNLGTNSDDTKVFVQNIPLDVTEDQMKELLEKHGKLKLANLLKDPATGVSKGYGFFEFEDARSSKLAVLHLNGSVLGKNVLSVKHAAFGYFASGGKPIDCKASNLPNSITQSILSNPLLGLQLQNGRRIGSNPSKVIQLLNMVFHEDLISDYNYNEIVRLVKEEAQKYGPLQEVVIPRPDKDLTFKEGVGKVFIRYEDLLSARKAQYMFNGRVFDKNRIVCSAFFPEDLFITGKYTLI